jgi:hypothetical protein
VRRVQLDVWDATEIPREIAVWILTATHRAPSEPHPESREKDHNESDRYQSDERADERHGSDRNTVELTQAAKRRGFDSVAGYL